MSRSARSILMRLVLASVLVVALGAESAAQPASPLSPLSPPPSSTPVSVPTPASPSAPLAALATAGLAALPEAPSPATQRALAAARKALARRQLEQARTHAREAFTRSPGLAEARYLLAVLDVRAGALAEARRHLEQLAAEDLAQFAPRLEADAELAPLRASPEGAALRVRLGELARLWEAATAQGVPVQLFAGAPGSQGILSPRVLRPGVWVHAARRFYALTPPLPDVRGALVDLERGQVVTVALAVDDCHHDFCPIVRRTTVSVWPLAAAARPSATWIYKGEMAHGATVQSVDGGARVQVRDCLHTGCLSPWQLVTAAGNRKAPEQRRLAAPTVEVDHRGGSLAVPAAGLSLEGAALHSAGGSPIALGKRHRLTEQHCVVAEGDRALVASTVDRCECGSSFEGAVLVHQLTRVDLASGAAESLSIGKGVAAAVRGRDGAVYLQRAGRVTRFPSLADLGTTGTTGKSELLPEGLVLVAPVQPHSNCCGL